MLDEDSRDASLEQLLLADAMVLGGKSYEGLAAVWPRLSSDPTLGRFAERINSMPKYVASRTLTEPLERNASLIEGDIGQAVSAMKAEHRGNLFVSGCGELAHTVTRQGLVDEFWFWVLVGGFLPSGAVGLWGILALLGALVFLEVRQAVRWFAAFLLVFLLTGILGEVFFTDADLSIWFTSTMLALNAIGAGSVAFTLLAAFAGQRNAALRALRIEQEKAEALLVNVLPSSIAERLKGVPKTIADHFESASILFADVVDFTPLARHLAPPEVVGVLDQLFSHFDTLVERHGLEKIKTIGDCYMAACGVPDPSPNHARKAALLALDMRDAVAASAIAGQPGLELRIGINSGPVVAGVIGTKRFLYDLWGDAVNIASRMETNGTPGEIQITHATYEMLKDEFVCRRRGMIQVKGKGEMETWYLVGSRPDDARREGGSLTEAGTVDPA